MTYDMEGCLRSYAQLHEPLFPDAGKLRPTVTPCTCEDHKDATATKAVDASQANLASCLEDEVELGVCFQSVGVGSPIERMPHTSVAQVVLKSMYAARMARGDLRRGISYMARFLTRWGQAAE